MEKLNFKIQINAPRGKVWQVLFDDQTYRKWTEPFMAGSYAVTDWQKGSKALFLSPDKNGMVSRIAENIPNEFLSIEHLGFVSKGVEDTESEKVKQWAGAMENYTLKESNVGTELFVDMDSNEEFKKMFSDIWPKALQKVKELSESN